MTYFEYILEQERAKNDSLKPVSMGKEYSIGQLEIYALLYGPGLPPVPPAPDDGMPNSRDEGGKTWRDRKRLL